jgi:hypothetical protein
MPLSIGIFLEIVQTIMQDEEMQQQRIQSMNRMAVIGVAG